MDAREFCGRLQGVKRSGKGYVAKCPAHDDKTASLSINQKAGADGKERVMIFCHAGCAMESVLAAMGLTTRDLIVNPDPPREGGNGRGRGNTGTRQKAAGNGDVETVAGIRVHTVGNGSEAAENGASSTGTGTARSGSGNNSGNGSGNGAGNGAGNSFGNGTGNGSGNGGGNDGSGGGLQIDWEHPVRTYSYTDENGNEMFQVVRYRYLNANGKTFRQRMRPTEEMKASARAGKGPKISRDGWVNNVPSEIRDRYLYRLPNVLEAQRAGRKVYLVEGEKDVETMERLGYAATCNPGGAGKWNDLYTAILAGKAEWLRTDSEDVAGAISKNEVIILPDMDPVGSKGNRPGQDHAWNVALALHGAGCKVKIVNLKEACPEIPEKGDISDMAQIMGDERAKDALARQISETREFHPGMVPFWMSPMEQAAKLYGAIGNGYDAENGCIVQHVGDNVKALTDFVVIPKMELTIDDGEKSEVSFVLDGWNSLGHRLKRVSIKGSDLDGMNWVTDSWGFDASVLPGTTTKNKVAWTIKKVGQMTAQRITQYRHTGWRKIGEKWCYLYQGGAIGMDGVRVDMGQNAINRYQLDGGGTADLKKITYKAGCEKSLAIMKVMKKELGIALLGVMYLAPLREWMARTDVSPAFSLFLYGETGTHKSTAAALAMSHYGHFSSRNAPANFHDTGNQIREKAFLLKDMPIWVDDFHPTTSQQEKRQMNATAQTLCRAFGDGADRGRLNADRTLSVARPPRSVAMITGEDLPAVGASGLARFFIVDVEKGDIPFTPEFSQLQEDARMGYLQKAMRGYIQWLGQQTEQLPEMAQKFFLQNRDYVRAQSQDGHDRAPEAVAAILTGYGFMLRYMQSVGAIEQKDWGEMMLEARKAMIAASDKQTQSLESEKPTRIFLNGLIELMRSNQAGVLDLTLPDAKYPGGLQKMIGYRDNDYYYFLPEVTHGLVASLCRTQGQEFPVSLKALYKHLRTDGILPPIDGSGDTYTRMKWIQGKATRLLWIPVEHIDGKPANAEQLKLKMESEYIPSSEAPPEGWV